MPTKGAHAGGILERGVVGGRSRYRLYQSVFARTLLGAGALMLSAPVLAQQTPPSPGSKPGGSTTSGGGAGTNGCDDCGGSDEGGPAPANDIVAPQIYTVTPGGINVAEGGFVHNETDLSLGTLSVERHYDGIPPDPSAPGNDRDPETLPFGVHATHNLEIYVASSYVPANGPTNPPAFPVHYHTVVHLGAGASGTYWQTTLTSASTTADDGEAEKGTLQMVSGAYVYTDQSGTVYQFNPSVHITGAPGGVDMAHSQRVASITYPDGRVRAFSYDASSRLKLVTDTTGYAIVFDYNGSGLISAACAFDTARNYVTTATTCSGSPLHSSYAYSAGNLTQATDVFGKVTTYTYSSALITCVQPPAATGCQVANSYSGRSVTQTMANGAVWHVNVSGTFARDSEYTPADGDDVTTVIDPNGKTSTYTFTGTTPYDATDANAQVTHYTFVGGTDLLEGHNTTVHSGSLLTEVLLPEGNKYQQTNGGPYHAISAQTYVAKSGSGLANLTQSLGYTCMGGTLNATCTKPTSRTDANGNTTNYAYFSHGGVQWEMRPAPASGAARPLKLYTYVQKYAYVLNASSALVPSGGPIWMPSSLTECQTVAGSSAASCDPSAPQVVTTYEYGADGTVDNLLLRGRVVSSGGVTRRTCYGYDTRSNRISETAARAGLTSCP